MPTPHIDSTIAAIKENWFIGGNAGPKYAAKLQQEVDRRNDKAQVDAAMALGNYFWPTEEKPQKLHAIRAVLLAAFVIKKTPLVQKDGLVTRYEQLTLEQLKTSFRSQFPPFEDNNKRVQWAPANFTALNTLNDFEQARDWRNRVIPDFRLFVHTLKAGSEGNLLTAPVATLSGWDAISMSVISRDKPSAYSNFGLIMSIPENNILVTSPMDAWFHNRAGGNSSDRGSKSEGLSMSHHILERNAMVTGMLTPTEVLNLTNTQEAFLNHNTGTNLSKYNEIVVTGRANTRLPHGMTGALSVIGLFMHIKKDGTLPARYTTAAQNADTAVIQQNMIAAQNRLNVPLLYLPHINDNCH